MESSDGIDYEARIARMINRNSGMRGKTRTDEEREPKNEIITSRIREDSDLSSSLGSSGISSGSNQDSETKSSSSEDDSLVEEEGMVKASGRRRHSGAEQMQQPNQWTSLTVDQGEDTKTSKKEEEMRQDTSEFVTEKPKRVPVLAKCEVLVVGGGPAGLSAALGARRAGADVILCEAYGCFGGVITQVGMETIAWYRYEGCMNDSEGVGVEMERLAASMGGTSKFPYNDSECLDADFFKIVADHLITSSGIRPILHCFAVEAIMEGNTIKGIITESKSGRRAIIADRVIDCTGDADVAHFAGAEYRLTPKNEAMGMTTVLNTAGVNKTQFLDYVAKKPATYADWSRVWSQETDGKENHLKSPYLDDEFVKAREQGIITDADNIGGSWSALSDAGEATNLNLAHVMNVDATDVLDLTKAEMEGRQQAMNALVAMKKVIPGFEKAKLRNFGMKIGTRDSRKIIGRYNLTSKDVRNQAKFEDSIGIFPEFIDGYNILILPTTGRYFQVPYGCMVPPNISNLLVAGRCVAGDKTSHAAMRNMMACTVTGQGAGVAAAISLKHKKSTLDIDIDVVQEELKKQGVRIH